LDWRPGAIAPVASPLNPALLVYLRIPVTHCKFVLFTKTLRFSSHRALTLPRLGINISSRRRVMLLCSIERCDLSCFPKSTYVLPILQIVSNLFHWLARHSKAYCFKVEKHYTVEVGQILLNCARCTIQWMIWQNHYQNSGNLEKNLRGKRETLTILLKTSCVCEENLVLH